ncbi:MAG: sigma-54 interaction domain-containing protein, partial [Desulforhopalus sp.]
FADILGNAPLLLQCKEHAELYAVSEAPVLIYGKTGTGKELFAQAIHNASPRKLFPFVAINCATLPSDLMESELFGYVKGAFTGASSDGKQGLVDQAHLGTLFLDEVDSLSSALQAKLLRLLQEKEFIRVGGNEVIPVDIRIVAACNKRQHEDSEKNPLRQDLFYRLSTLYLQLPDLLERKTDIPLLFEHFLEQYDNNLAAAVCPLPQDVLEIFSGLSFTGNLRELQSVAARFACLCKLTKVTSTSYLAGLLESCCHGSSVPGGMLPGGRSFAPHQSGSLASLMNEAEKTILDLTKKRCGGSVQSMAQQLAVGRTTLWRKLKAHNLN